ncbi:Uncharacterised protein [Mycobacteroides abscessus subsp. massiliense]|nr:Uncharacterised protein [Mycobacteroides abscessus subsp. massiliense]SKG95430.1 Uncharacterised protein [Mycobacteroides abscessus subsp. massiliense]SKH76982.1 Uncharacterised protein [Mycobacteroides abscessus subsp. massiliense]SKI58507.1 Uncharacterised protein [Mycobacteroides abscessus subsp. massiliense]SKI71322.1 Uncharacterised protein [Mycobacteroides abscessus subsp. massiliense]
MTADPNTQHGSTTDIAIARFTAEPLVQVNLLLNSYK